MQHAGSQAREQLSKLLDKLRARTALVERTPGSFYLHSKAFLHFHDDAAGLFADVKLDLRSFTRMRVSTQIEQSRLLTRIDACLAAQNAPTRKKRKSD